MKTLLFLFVFIFSESTVLADYDFCPIHKGIQISASCSANLQRIASQLNNVRQKGSSICQYFQDKIFPLLDQEQANRQNFSAIMENRTNQDVQNSAKGMPQDDRWLKIALNSKISCMKAEQAEINYINEIQNRINDWKQNNLYPQLKNYQQYFSSVGNYAKQVNCKNEATTLQYSIDKLKREMQAIDEQTQRISSQFDFRQAALQKAVNTCTAGGVDHEEALRQLQCTFDNNLTNDPMPSVLPVSSDPAEQATRMQSALDYIKEQQQKGDNVLTGGQMLRKAVGDNIDDPDIKEGLENSITVNQIADRFGVDRDALMKQVLQNESSLGIDKNSLFKDSLYGNDSANLTDPQKIIDKNFSNFVDRNFQYQYGNETKIPVSDDPALQVARMKQLQQDVKSGKINLNADELTAEALNPVLQSYLGKLPVTAVDQAADQYGIAKDALVKEIVKSPSAFGLPENIYDDKNSAIVRTLVEGNSGTPTDSKQMQQVLNGVVQGSLGSQVGVKPAHSDVTMASIGGFIRGIGFDTPLEVLAAPFRIFQGDVPQFPLFEPTGNAVYRNASGAVANNIGTEIGYSVGSFYLNPTPQNQLTVWNAINNTNNSHEVLTPEQMQMLNRVLLDRVPASAK